MQIGPVGEKLFYADGHDEANSRSSQITTAAKYYYQQHPLNISPTSLAIFVTWAMCCLIYVKRGMERGSLENVKFTQ
jgi:hypothetical protein